MTYLTGFILFSLSALVVLAMVVQGARRTVELLTIRNLFLAGFVVFQLASGGLSQFFDDYGEVSVYQTASTGLIYLLIASVFLLTFWISYSRGWLVARHVQRRAGSDRSISTFAAIPVAFLLLGVGIVLRLVIGRTVPVLGVLTDIMGIGVVCAAAGLAAWVWVPRLWNPVVGVPAAIVILIAAGSLLLGSFGRREILSLLFTLFFAAYYSRWRDLSLVAMSYRLGVVVAAGLIFVAAFTSVRGSTFKMKDISSVAKGIGQGDIGAGIMQLASGQFAGANSMWTIESYPEDFPYKPFASVIYTITNPIPRVLWPGKPLAFGYEIVRECRSPNLGAEGYTMGPGLVGHIVHDNPWLTVIPYAVFLGLFCRWLDEHLRVRGSDPFVVLPITAGAGEVLGFARGELGLFFFRTVVSIFAAWVAMRICASVVGRARDTSSPGGPSVEGEYGDEEPFSTDSDGAPDEAGSSRSPEHLPGAPA